jgi:hypothetical protein
MQITGNTLNNTELLSAYHTGRLKDGKKEYVILCRYHLDPNKIVVSMAYENETGWCQGHYFHREHEENAWKAANELYFNMIKKYGR